MYKEFYTNVWKNENVISSKVKTKLYGYAQVCSDLRSTTTPVSTGTYRFLSRDKEGEEK